MPKTRLPAPANAAKKNAPRGKRSPAKRRPAPRPFVCSISDGRARLAGLVQAASVEKAIIGFDRYGQAVAALVPIEAIRILAGADSDVGADTRRGIRRMARQLLATLPESVVLASRGPKSVKNKTKK